MLKVSNLTKSNWSTELFYEADFSISEWVKVGLVGPNWSGKSTLLKILAGIDKDYTGSISFKNKKTRIGYIQQELYVEDNCNIIEFLKRETWISALEADLKAAYEKLSEDPKSKKLLNKISVIEDELNFLNYHQIDSKIETILEGLWFERAYFSKKVSDLSWWQKRRVLLALILIKGIDLLLLDEPTNDLDYYAIQWLKNYIKTLKHTTVVIVSHNKNFLNYTISKVLAINTHTKKIDMYTGNYTDYERIMEENLMRKEWEFTKQEEYIEVIQKNIEIAQNKATRTHFKIRDNDKWSRNKKKDNWQRIQWQIIKRLSSQLERLDMEKPYRKKPLHFLIKTEKIADWNIIIDNFSYAYKDTWFCISIPHLEIKAWQKIVIIWRNGSGKSTFIKALLWELKDMSKTINIPSSFDIWYLGQQLTASSDENMLLQDYIYKYKNKCIVLEEEMLENVLQQFELNHPKKKVSDLSPGQKIRMQLAIFYINQNNLLILDEPTNHLDMEAIEVLEIALHEYNWTLIVVSHDEDFIKNIQPDAICVMNDWKLSNKST